MGFEPLEPGPVVYLNEAPTVTFDAEVEKAGLRNSRDLHVIDRPVTPDRWSVVVAEAARKCEETGARLLVVDTIGPWAEFRADDEYAPGTARAALAPLQRLAEERQMTVLVLRHERKSGGDIGESGMGSTAFTGAVDISLTMRRLSGDGPSAARAIHYLGRLDGIPQRLVVELANVGYVIRSATACPTADDLEEFILAAAPRSEEDALADLAGSVKSLLDEVDARRVTNGLEPVPKSTFDDELKRLVSRGALARGGGDPTGRGVKGRPYVYWRQGRDSSGAAESERRIPEESPQVELSTYADSSGASCPGDSVPSGASSSSLVNVPPDAPSAVPHGVHWAGAATTRYGVFGRPPGKWPLDDPARMALQLAWRRSARLAFGGVPS